MTRTQSLGVCALSAAVSVALTGCSFSIGTPAAENDTIPVQELAAAAEKQIFDEFGATVDVDCGAAQVPFVVGTQVNCTGLDTASDLEAALLVEIVLVDGDYFEIEFWTIPDEEPSQNEGSGVFVPAADFEDTVADALESVLGERVVPQCGRGDVEIVVGDQLICAVVLSSGFGEALVTITSFDGSTYEITAELIED